MVDRLVKLQSVELSNHHRSSLLRVDVFAVSDELNVGVVRAQHDEDFVGIVGKFQARLRT